jgi:hypothetical protein
MRQPLPTQDAPLVVKPKLAWRMLGCGNTHGYELLAAGELDSFLDGRGRKITVESIHRYIARRLAAQDPTNKLHPTSAHQHRGRSRNVVRT